MLHNNVQKQESKIWVLTTLLELNLDNVVLLTELPEIIQNKNLTLDPFNNESDEDDPSQEMKGKRALEEEEKDDDEENSDLQTLYDNISAIITWCRHNGFQKDEEIIYIIQLSCYEKLKLIKDDPANDVIDINLDFERAHESLGQRFKCLSENNSELEELYPYIKIIKKREKFGDSQVYILKWGFSTLVTYISLFILISITLTILESYRLIDTDTERDFFNYLKKINQVFIPTILIVTFGIILGRFIYDRVQNPLDLRRVFRDIPMFSERQGNRRSFWQPPSEIESNPDQKDDSASSAHQIDFV